MILDYFAYLDDGIRLSVLVGDRERVVVDH